MKRINIVSISWHTMSIMLLTWRIVAGIGTQLAMNAIGFVVFLGALLVSPIHRCQGKRCEHCARCYRISYLHIARH